MKRLATALILATLPVGCTRPSPILEMAKTHSLEKPYGNRIEVALRPTEALAAVLQVLGQEGASIMVVDSGGLVSWCDRTGAFHPLSRDMDSTSRRKPEAFTPAAFHGVIFAAARFKPSRTGTIIYLHATRHDEREGILSYSDGSYERHILRILTDALVRENSP